MANFAELNENNIVTKVLVVSNEDIKDSNGNESEEIGINFLENIFGHRNWKQTSYNSNFRINYAGVGYKYHRDIDGFSPPQPFPSWSLNEKTLEWEAPITKPSNGVYSWNEDHKVWIKVG